MAEWRGTRPISGEKKSSDIIKFMKQCVKCLQEKPLIDFVVSKSTKSGFKAYCKECQKNQQRKYFLANREKRRSQIKINMRAWKTRLKQEIDAYKARPCLDCGNTFPVCCMDFDHLDGTKKVDNISAMISNRTTSREKIYEEISKCELVCSNCHRIRTHQRIKNGHVA